jgi:signal transduction histidine kinase
LSTFLRELCDTLVVVANNAHNDAMTHPEGHVASRHKCLIYDGAASEQLPVVVPLLVNGLGENWRCLYLGSPATVEMVDDALARNGVDTARERERGALVLSSSRDHLADGRFDPGAMVDSLSSSIDEAVAEGFQGLCATGDMRWELGADENFEHLLEYEARLEALFREKPLRGVCQYHRGMVPAQAVRDALVTHRSAYLGDRLDEDNLFYVPPELLLQSRGARDGASHADWMCRQIVRVLDAERTRDDVLRELERRVADRTAELAVANRHLQSFSYAVSHDLRAPVRSVLGFADALQHDCGDRLGEDGRRHLERIVAAGHRMSELIEGMLVLGRALDGELRRAPVDLSALAREVAAELREAEPARVVELVVQDGLSAVGDRVLLRAALTNLLANAWKFTARRPRGRVEVGRGAGGAFFVRDNGAGFDMAYVDKLFGAFQRLHTTEQFPGTGVGLATVERIVSRHGGRIWAEGRPDEGATFSFTLPGD